MHRKRQTKTFSNRLNNDIEIYADRNRKKSLFLFLYSALFFPINSLLCFSYFPIRIFFYSLSAGTIFKENSRLSIKIEVKSMIAMNAVAAQRPISEHKEKTRKDKKNNQPNFNLSENLLN